MAVDKDSKKEEFLSKVEQGTPFNGIVAVICNNDSAQVEKHLDAFLERLEPNLQEDRINEVVDGHFNSIESNLFGDNPVKSKDDKTLSEIIENSDLPNIKKYLQPINAEFNPVIGSEIAENKKPDHENASQIEEKEDKNKKEEGDKLKNIENKPKKGYDRSLSASEIYDNRFTGDADISQSNLPPTYEQSQAAYENPVFKQQPSSIPAPGGGLSFIDNDDINKASEGLAESSRLEESDSVSPPSYEKSQELHSEQGRGRG